ncbi:restriction endonuclease subunit S [Serratia marcescens]|uniref:restriction endonuclease subunit S n=1 Tax=Serratia marcescens TaxID=615 RepID=UPI002178A5B9|nr:restriction endonuclease subunit S [Serratia marcescens]CAI1611239.1 Type I restriction enzyme EcoKI specificity protein [Serratia marcescens]
MDKYKAYPEYKDSGVEWLGLVPKSWTICRLKNLATIKNGQDYKSVQTDDGYPVMGSGGQFTFASEFMYDKPSVLLGRKGTIDKPLYINEPFWTVDTMYYTELNKGVDAKYLYYLALTIQFSRYSTNTALPSMTQEHLNNYKFSVPKAESERKKITDFLDHETAKIDNLIEKQQQLIELLEEKRQAVISHAVTKGLNPDVPMKDSGVKWLGKVPEHWSIIKLKHLINSFEQGWSPQCEARLAEKNEYGVLKVGCVNSGKFNSLEHKALPSNLEPQKQYLLKKNDLLISRANTKELVGSSAVVDKNYDNLILCDKLYRVKLISSVNPFFISEYIRTPFVRKQIELSASGASHSMQNIGQDTIKELFVALPPENEVQLLIDFIEKEANVFNTLTDLSHQQVALLQERRTALISAAVTGKIDVRDWVVPDMQDAEEPQETTA